MSELTKKQVKRLRDALADQELIWSKRMKLGGRETTATADFIRRAKNLLGPEDADRLADEMEAHAAIYVPYAGRGNIAEEHIAAEAAEADRIHAEATKKMHAAQEAQRKLREQQRAVAQRAVSEVL